MAILLGMKLGEVDGTVTREDKFVHSRSIRHSPFRTHQTYKHTGTRKEKEMYMGNRHKPSHCEFWQQCQHTADKETSMQNSKD